MKNLMALILIAGLLSACNKKITNSWKNPQHLFAYDTIIVTALTINLHAKNIVERQIADELAERGIHVSKSCEVFPPNFTDKDIKRDLIMDKIHRRGVNGILMISIIDTESENRFSSTTYAYEPLPWQARSQKFWNYFTHWYPQVYTPRYYIPGKTYFIEANLYDASTEELIWSAQSATYKPAELRGFSKEFAAIVANKLEKDEIIFVKGKESSFLRLSAKAADRQQP